MSNLTNGQIVIDETGLPYKITSNESDCYYARAEFDQKFNRDKLRLATDEECIELGLKQVS